MSYALISSVLFVFSMNLLNFNMEADPRKCQPYNEASYGALKDFNELANDLHPFQILSIVGHVMCYIEPNE